MGWTVVACRSLALAGLSTISTSRGAFVDLDREAPQRAHQVLLQRVARVVRPDGDAAHVDAIESTARPLDRWGHSQPEEATCSPWVGSVRGRAVPHCEDANRLPALDQ